MADDKTGSEQHREELVAAVTLQRLTEQAQKAADEAVTAAREAVAAANAATTALKEKETAETKAG